MNSPKKILIVRTDRIGDVVLSLPMAEFVKKKYPDSYVAYLVRKYTSVLPASNPTIDEVIISEESNRDLLFYSNLQKLKSKNFDTCIVVNPTLKIALILFLAGIKIRIGTGFRWYSFLFNEKVFEHRKYADKHELDYNINLLSKLDISKADIPDEIDFHLSIDEDSAFKIDTLLNKEGFQSGNKLVIIHPGSGGSSVDLPEAKMIELTTKISRLENVTVVITGSENESELCRKFEVDKSVINLAGNLDLPLLIALINKSNLFISNSTGPMHIAAALGVYVFAFFPKIPACSQNRWGPYTKKKSLFVPTIDCSNCTRKQCENLNCMNSIDIGKVFDETRAVLKI